MNGSGLQDEAVFSYDPTRLTDARQPLQQEVLAAINAYVQAQPELKKGDLVTIGSLHCPVIKCAWATLAILQVQTGSLL
jgi:hypothetical protein